MATFIPFGQPAVTGEAMTIDGTVNKTALLLLLVVAGAMWPWGAILSGDYQSTATWLAYGFGAGLGGMVVGFVTIFKKQWAMFTAPLYAVLEGVFIGCASALVETQYPGIVVQAVGLTFGTLGCLLLAYRSRLIQVTDKFRLGVVAATGAVMVLYLASFALGFFGISFPFIHDNGPVGILISAVIVGIAALNLILDFDFIEQGAAAGAPNYMEWYGGFALLVTPIWLYIEILRLLAKLRSRD